MLEKALRSAPSNPDVLRSVASYYRDTRHYDESIRVLEGLRTKDANSLVELAYSYTLAGNVGAAARVYGEAASRAPGNVEVQLNAAQAMIAAGNFGKAAELLDHASTLQPEHYRLYALLGPPMAAAQRQDADAIRVNTRNCFAKKLPQASLPGRRFFIPSLYAWISNSSTVRCGRYRQCGSRY